MRLSRVMNKAARTGQNAGFTLAELLAAMMFMAIVIPVVVDALRITSLTGEVAALKGEAMHIADRVLNENIVATNLDQSVRSGVINEDGRPFSWKIQNDLWEDDTMQVLTAEVNFSVQDREYSVKMSTLTGM